MPHTNCRDFEKTGNCTKKEKCKFNHPITAVKELPAIGLLPLYSFGSCTFQQRANEDRNAIYLLSPECRLFIVCDGHGNPSPFHPQDDEDIVVNYVIKYLHLRLAQSLQQIDMNNE